MRNRLSALIGFFGRTGLHVAFVFALVCGLFLLPDVVSAQTQAAVDSVQLTAEAAGVDGSQDLLQIIGRIINVFLGFLGIIFLGLMLYAGYLYMTAAGDAKKVEDAIKIIRNAIIGLVLIASAWAITLFVLGLFTGDGMGGGIFGGQQPGGTTFPSSSGSLGNGVIESVLPEPNSVGNPRNTPIIVTFKNPVYPGSFIRDWTDATSATTRGLNTDNVRIYRVESGVSSALSTEQARVFYTQDLKTYVIRPVEYLGSPTVNVGYMVELTGGSRGIRANAFNPDGTTRPENALQPIFTGAFSSGYDWPFEVSTVIDLVPPVVTATMPPSTGQYARNLVVQIHFNKAMDPTAVTGVNPAFSNLQVLAASNGNPPTTPVSGEFRISNHYRTVEFVTDSRCGTNSCNVDIYCLPADASIHVEARAATIDSAAPPQAIFTNNGYDGVVSAVGNSLDGNRLGGDGTAVGPPGDNFVLDFATNNTIQLVPPRILSTVPDSEPSSGASSNIPLDQPMIANFDTMLQSSTVNTDNAVIRAHGPGETNPDAFWFTAGVRLLNADGSEFNPSAGSSAPARSAIVLGHRVFLPSGTGVSRLNFYDPYIYSGVQDVYQNCFNPAAVCGTGSGNPNCCNNRPSAAGCASTLNP